MLEGKMETGAAVGAEAAVGAGAAVGDLIADAVVADVLRALSETVALQYRAFADPLQRVLTDGDRSRGVVREVLGRIARKQDAELSNLVATQQKEIAGLKAKAAASLSSLSEEEALHDQCKSAIARGLIDNTTPATQALLRVLKHCHPAAAAFKTVVSLPDPYHHACQHEQSSVAPKKSDPFFLPPGRKVPSYEPTLTLARPCRVRPRNEAVSKETIVPPSCIPTMRPEEWVRQQRLKNASEMSSIILQSMSKVPRPSDRQGLSWFLPQRRSGPEHCDMVVCWHARRDLRAAGRAFLGRVSDLFHQQPDRAKPPHDGRYRAGLSWV